MAEFSLPDFPQVDAEVLREISRRHGLEAAASSPLPEVGVFNRIYPLGDDLVLRVPRDHPAFVAAARKESVAVPAAKEAGVRTPAMISFDDARDLLPVPYSIFERVPGETLGLLDLDPARAPGAWRDLGRDLARLHSGVPEDGPAAGLELEAMPDPRPWPDEISSEGYFTSTEARWFSEWLDRLAPAALAPVRRRFLHGDSQATNVMVEAGSLEYLAVLDWGGSGWGDPAWDFAGVPLRVVPSMLEGYGEVAPPDGVETIEARILWRHLQLGLYLLRRDPQPGRSWAERPLGMLLDAMRFLLRDPGEEWSRWTP
ncbi:MAG TPA: aminoglycoside phosphotransferase family protein [Rubrobacter sp.]|nr:aminoglycoside phosphotransferase family protein [Rubrobacter sp.]